MPFDRLSRDPRLFPGMIENRSVTRAFRTHARFPFGHVARRGGVEAEAEAEANFAAFRNRSGNQSLLAGYQAKRVRMDERVQAARGLRPLRVTRPCSSRPRVFSQSSAAGGSLSRALRGAMPLESICLTRCSGATLPG